MSFTRKPKTSPALWQFLIVGIALMLASTAGTATSQPAEPPKGLAEIKPATPMPVFTLPEVGGATFNSSALEDKVVVVRFWATW
jgi:cytochrome oxidase Cu insertion factor (SCO1/SenC/PrrC family)